MTLFERVEAKLNIRRSLPDPATRRALRVAAGLSQEDIAEDLEVTRAAISRWESGEREPRGTHLVAYCELLELLRRQVV